MGRFGYGIVVLLFGSSVDVLSASGSGKKAKTKIISLGAGHDATVEYQSSMHQGINKMPLQGDFLTGAGTPLAHSADATYPVWFVIGTRPAGVQEDPRLVPRDFALMQNYPNPFNPSTTIRHNLASSGYATLIVYDVIGREVRTLMSESQKAGSHFVVFDAAGLPSGVYFCRLSVEGRDGTISYRGTRETLLLK